jgi:predicted O-methyltransferase YrrM
MSDTAYKVFTCDIDDWVLDTVVLSSNAQFIPRSTLVKLKDLPGSRMITMVFIDGLHTEAAVCADIALAREVVKKRGGIIVLHDIELPPVKEAIKQAGLKQIVEFGTHYGLGVYEP